MTKWKTVMATTNENNVYHTNKDCRAIGDNIREVSESELMYHDLRECAYCKNGGSTDKTGYGKQLHKKLVEASPEDFDP